MVPDEDDEQMARAASADPADPAPTQAATSARRDDRVIDPAADASRAPTTAGSKEAIAGGALDAATRHCQRTAQQAWLRAAEDVSNAQFEFSASRQRIAHETQLALAEAYFRWLNAAHAAADDAGKDLRDANDSYARSCDEIAKAAAEKAAGLQMASEQRLAATAEAYAQAIDGAVGEYLARFKSMWAELDIASADPQTLATLISASAHAARLAHATPRAQVPS